MLDESRTCFCLTMHDIEHACWQTSFFQYFGEDVCAMRRVIAWLEDNRVASCKCWKDLPRWNSNWEVPCSDDTTHTDRHPEGHIHLVVHLRWCRVAEQTTCLCGGVVGSIDGFLDITLGFLQRLAHFTRHDRSKLVLATCEDVTCLAQDVSALRCRHQAPRTEGCRGSTNGRCNIVSVRQWEHADDIGAISRVQICECATR